MQNLFAKCAFSAKGNTPDWLEGREFLEGKTACQVGTHVTDLELKWLAVGGPKVPA